MSENKNQKIESYYNHDDAYPHLKREQKRQQEEVSKATNIEPPAEEKPSLNSLGEVISPLYGKKLDGANDFKSTMSSYEHNLHYELEGAASNSINEIIEQKIVDKKAELAKIHVVEEKVSDAEKVNIEQYFKKYNPLTDGGTIKSTLKNRNKLSEQAAQTVSFLFKPRKNGENVFGERTAELTLELEQIKQKISNPKPRYQVDEYEQTALFEGLEEQKLINEQIRQVVAEAYHIDDNFSENMPLEQRRSLIKHNSTKAGAVRFKTLLNLQESNLNNQFLRRSKPIAQYHQNLHDLRKDDSNSETKHVNDYYTKRNPYLSRMLELEERTAREAEEKRKERVKAQINESKNLDKDENK
ncbi:hypothetical protein [Spiroplasma endosymbiont of Phyllotreta cruciferae]|uniref:hypothetical protein n=1 Tax=Spiroplasma endosymbiont of Phyllotreta cruciferae TaxID=2886375 RepID=UPI00209E8861|nr:hypothetical protein [Spiroplasma endosymbiont of Phyllotreta cruciferae]